MRYFFVLWMVAGVLVSSSSARAVTLGQLDDFEDGTTMNWAGGRVTITQEADGGPAGVGDGYLQVSQINFHVATNNEAQWTGDYLSAGVAGIRMDLNPISVTPNPLNPDGILGMRLVLFGPGGAFTSVTPITLEEGWNSYVFDLSDMMFLTGSTIRWPGGGTEVLADTLADVSIFLIRHDPGASPKPVGQHPEHITATLGLNNIRAAPGLGPVGDRDGDGFVGQDDLDIVLGAWGTGPPSDPRADVNDDDFVGQDDLDAVLADWGQGIPPPGIPEPATVGMLALSGLALLRRKWNTR